MPQLTIQQAFESARQHHQAGRLNEAEQLYRQILAQQPDHAEALHRLGAIAQQRGQPDRAVDLIRRAITAKPNYPQAYNKLGNVLMDQGQVDPAITAYRQAIALQSAYPEAQYNLGNCLRIKGHLDEAVAAYHQAITLKPDFAQAHNNLGYALQAQGQVDEAIATYRRAVALQPNYAEAHANLGMANLLVGNFPAGWPDYEWRQRGRRGPMRREHPGKMWDGRSLAGKRILLQRDQGLGDTFQFVRYAGELKSRGATVILECPPALRPILGRTPGIDAFVMFGESPPAGDFYSPLLSVPGLCQTNLDNIPSQAPYIFTDPALVAEWKQRLTPLAGLKIGIVWQGSPEHTEDRNRSIALAAFAPLAAVPGVTLITLQKGVGVEQIAMLNGQFALVDFNGVAEETDGFLRTAAIMANLDLVISVDTAVAHLAGAMGLPVWLLLPIAPDWRWLLNREDSPWYPTLRIFRQTRRGDWHEVLARMAQALPPRITASRSTTR